MQILAILIALAMALVMLVGLGSLGVIVYKAATDDEAGGPLHAIGALFCGPYAMIWGFQNGKRLKLTPFVVIYTIAWFIQTAAQVFQVLVGGLATIGSLA